MSYTTAASGCKFVMIDETTGRSVPVSTDEFVNLMQSRAPPIQESPEALEAGCIALVATLFRSRDVHPVVLDGKEIDPIDGASPWIEYTRCVNGHTLSTTEGKRIYTCYTYINCVEMQEQVVIQGDAITAILINTFDYAGIHTSAPGHASWHRDLYHARQVLSAAVEQCASTRGGKGSSS